MLGRDTSTNDMSLPDADDKERALPRNVSNLYLRNKLSAKDTAVLVRDAEQSGAKHVKDMAVVGSRGKHLKNYERDLSRKLVRDCNMPEPYMAAIPVRCRTTGKQIPAWLPILLAHELLFAM